VINQTKNMSTVLFTHLCGTAACDYNWKNLYFVTDRKTSINE